MSTYSTVERFEKALSKVAPYMAQTVQKSRGYAPDWEAEFEEVLSRLFGSDDQALAEAAQGYVEFSLDALRLHKRFEREGVYLHKTYQEVAEAVYHNDAYMFETYLPGILMTQYLWIHHYSQLQFFRRVFGPHLTGRFADVGVGTGFFSRQALAHNRLVRGDGYDISKASLHYARRQIDAFDFGDRWTAHKQDVLRTPPSERYPCVLSVEVLEHLEDPPAFLEVLAGMTQPGGHAFVTAALTAPEVDHIYLYRDCAEVIHQLQQAGFAVLAHQEDLAYAPKADEPVPRSAAFFCRQEN